MASDVDEPAAAVPCRERLLPGRATDESAISRLTKELEKSKLFSSLTSLSVTSGPLPMKNLGFLVSARARCLFLRDLFVLAFLGKLCGEKNPFGFN